MQPFTFVIASILFVFVLLYFTFFRPWQLRWGATDDEIKCPMSGDDIVQKPHFVATRAVSIKTRLITRLRTKYDFSFPCIIYYILYDFGDIVMMSKCMLGIKETAEENLYDRRIDSG